MKTCLAVIFVALLPTLAFADTMRCGSKIINEGTSQAKVEALCGKPAQIVRPDDHEGSDSALNEIWTYNFGPSKQMQRVRFRGGVVVEIDSVGRGY